MKKVLLSILVLSFFSCINEKTFSIEIENKTEFKINKLRLGCSFENKTIEIEPYSKTLTELKYNETTSKFIISRTFTEPQLCVTVLEYSDSTKRYENSVGSAIGINQLGEQNINHLVIEYRNELSYKFGIKVDKKK